MRVVTCVWTSLRAAICLRLPAQPTHSTNTQRQADEYEDEDKDGSVELVDEDGLDELSE